MSEWKQYTKNKLMKNMGNYIMVVPQSFSHEDVMPLFCEVCGFCFSTKADTEAYDEFKCCTSCADTWAYSNKKEWKNGWRPEPEQVQASIQKRVFVNSKIQFE